MASRRGQCEICELEDSGEVPHTVLNLYCINLWVCSKCLYNINEHARDMTYPKGRYIKAFHDGTYVYKERNKYED